jgi:hypothetical protein
MAELLERWLEWRPTVRPIAPTTVSSYRAAMDRYILPALGKLPVRQVDAATLDALYAHLRTRGGRNGMPPVLSSPKTESLIRLISRWVNNHQQPDDFYRDLLAKALGRSGAELFHDEGTQTELGVSPVPAELPHDVADFIGRGGETDDLRRRGDEGAGLDPTVVPHQVLRALGATSAELPSSIEAAARAFVVAWPAGGFCWCWTTPSVRGRSVPCCPAAQPEAGER